MPKVYGEDNVKVERPAGFLENEQCPKGTQSNSGHQVYCLQSRSNTRGRGWDEDGGSTIGYPPEIRDNDNCTDKSAIISEYISNEDTGSYQRGRDLRLQVSKTFKSVFDQFGRSLTGIIILLPFD